MKVTNELLSRKEWRLPSYHSEDGFYVCQLPPFSLGRSEGRHRQAVYGCERRRDLRFHGRDQMPPVRLGQQNTAPFQQTLRTL